MALSLALGPRLKRKPGPRSVSLRWLIPRALATGLLLVPTVAAAGVPTLRIRAISGATAQEVDRIRQGILLANKVMASTCFREEVLRTDFTENRGLSSAEIYAKLSAQPISLNVDLYMGDDRANFIYRTQGYEREPGTVHVNRFFIKQPRQFASLFMHEGEGHSQGFRHHYMKRTSVPYGMNRIFRTCVDRL